MADTTGRPSKRARRSAATNTSRENGSANGSTAGYKRSDTFWLRDGNLILVANHNTAFRVHQSVLERKSEVFKDMFGLPQPQNADPSSEGEEEEGCPVVHVSDAPEDITHLLSVLYDGDRFLTQNAPISMKTVLALLQLGIKYEIDYLRDEALSILQTIYPPSYAAYLEHCQGALWVTERTETQDAIVVINLAWKHGLHTLLPGAFFALAKLSNKELTRATNGSGSSSSLTTLSLSDLERCLTGRQTLQQQYTARFFFAEQIEMARDCTQSMVCSEVLESWWDGHVVYRLREIFNFNFDVLEEIDWEGGLKVCGECRGWHELDDKARRMAIYDRLADTFGLKEVVQGGLDAQAADED
ncbi:hypothetical protein EIP91_005094 [Steccherinum ochraceum]|uniref:BTB domain-containing protein n=1 Tax=Steccherinum ochraceum TaxID=92696 RepID=A0A4R0RG24_9APHY|nr:hypothetical protein EIP91_005094 [Steccherinum ochraceum]